ncbi:adenine phosphoribosyltransferase 1-like protein [Tanacetum coccineum]|uniref:adenine phosphoribosyltransferase n=1 Tax=Tanacetum coccineum TaxID=301880 RepID=A0ABQ5G5F1_9ASTR
MAVAPNSDDRVARITKAIRVIPDFPKPGILFQDITTLLLDPVAFKDTIDLFVERYKDKHISVVAGVEARGFIFGPPIALAIGAKFVPMRKPNKLPALDLLLCVKVRSSCFYLVAPFDEVTMLTGVSFLGQFLGCSEHPSYVRFRKGSSGSELMDVCTLERAQDMVFALALLGRVVCLGLLVVNQVVVACLCRGVDGRGAAGVGIGMKMRVLLWDGVGGVGSGERPVISEEYSLEYGTDKIEMHVGAVQEGERALVIDDLIATGGTLCAAINLLERVGVKVVECACVIELPELKVE